MLFEFFLPEKWRRTPRRKLVESQRWYETTTKDDVQVVWRESRVGERPDVDPFLPGGRRVLDHGYNSPFEEFSIALDLLHKGIDTKYPRTIYMTGSRSARLPDDRSRFDSHVNLLTPQGTPILRDNRKYVSIWGFWNVSDDMRATQGAAVYQRIDALSAYREGRLTEPDYLQLMRITQQRLAAANIEDLSFTGSHLLVSFDTTNRIKRDQQGMPLVRLRNYELLKKTTAAEKP